MSYFNQQKYSTSIIDTDENVEKGHKNKIKVDMTKFEELCKKFREKKDLKIKKLVGSDRDDYNLVVSYVNLMYGTTFYPQLFSKVRKYFDNVMSVKHGTVGAYFAGCLTANKKDQTMSTGCNISCAGSMPLPKEEEGWKFCDKAVIMAEKQGEGYELSMIKPAHTPEELEQAYLFVEAKSADDFIGFSQEEKDKILAYGCKNVKVVGYTSDMSYSDIYTEPKPISKIKHRHPKKMVSHKTDNDSSYLWLVLLILIILIIVLSVIAYRRVY